MPYMIESDGTCLIGRLDLPFCTQNPCAPRTLPNIQQNAPRAGLDCTKMLSSLCISLGAINSPRVEYTGVSIERAICPGNELELQGTDRRLWIFVG